MSEIWYAECCNVGEGCWCRIITKAKGSDRLEDCIIPSGSINKENAERIVRLNNEEHEREQARTASKGDT